MLTATYVGVIQPSWDIEGKVIDEASELEWGPAGASPASDHMQEADFFHPEYGVFNCFYNLGSGQCFTESKREESWTGQEDSKLGDRIGLLLEINSIGFGSLTAFKNGVRLGVLRDNLFGPFSWAVSLSESSDTKVSIRQAAVPT